MTTYKRKLSIRGLQAFEAISRHMSVSLAAEELGITQSAVSHQARLLAQDLGERLLVRQGRGIALSPAGKQLATRLQAAFADIERSVADVIGGNRDSIRLAVCSSFAPGWLVPRLHRFYAVNGAIDLKLSMYAKDPELTDAVADAFVTVKPEEPGFHSLFIRAERLVPVATRGGRHQPFNALPLITTDIDAGSIGRDWIEYGGLIGEVLPLSEDFRWLMASHYVMARDMARAGLGAALVPDFLVESDLRDGLLVQLHEAFLPTGEDYYLSVKQSRRDEPAIKALIRWFRTEIAKAADPSGAELAIYNPPPKPARPIARRAKISA